MTPRTAIRRNHFLDQLGAHLAERDWCCLRTFDEMRQQISTAGFFEA